MKPTDEQIKEFWEWCGFRQLELGRGGYHFRNTKKVWNWIPPNETERYKGIPFLPRIDLNNLFKYAVPSDIQQIILQPDVDEWYCGITLSDKLYEASNKDPALALFWAIYEVTKGVKDE